MEREAAVRALSDTGRWIMDKGMTWGTAGNLSVKLDADHLLITASGTRLDRLTEDSFTLVEISTGQFSGGKPSKELPVHLAAYDACPWAQAVVHASPLHATLLSMTDLLIRNDLFVENMYYLQRVGFVPYCHPGSPALAQAVGLAAGQSNVLLMENHGVLTYDASLSEAAMALEVLENTCRMLLLARSAELTLKGLPQETVRDFLLCSGYKPVRSWPKED